MASDDLNAGTQLARGIGLRDETTDDLAWLADLYAQTRAAELAPVPWSEEMKHAFLLDQFRCQREHYRSAYHDAAFLVIEREGAAIGRIYVHRSASEIRLMEISLLPTERGHGIGSLLIGALMDEAARNASSLTLHVEAYNPARRLYARLGFELIEDQGVYQFLGWSAPAT